MSTTVHRQGCTTTVKRRRQERRLLLALLLTCCGLAAAAAGHRSDADAVADLARSLARPPSTWTTAGGDPCSFEGISCSSSGRIIAIDLAGMGLAGTLPPSLSSLTALQSLQLGGNALSGAVPPLRAPSLTSLSLDGNAFTSLPKDFPRGMPALRHLSMDNLPLPPWPFPHAIAGCTSLRTFSASNASVAGPFQVAAAIVIANLTSIRTLRLSRNMLTGVVPAALGKIASLRDISLSSNFLQGPVPQFPAGVANDVVDGNSFCLDEPGPCNAQVSTLLQVAEGFGYPLNLASSWRGNYPCSGWLGLVCDNISDVAIILLQQAELSGTISPAIVDLIGLQILMLANNSLTGEIPESLTKLPKLELLDVTNNKLTGQLPKFKPSVRVLADGNEFIGENSHKVLLLMHDAGSHIDAAPLK
ncbi:hypothetical protein ACQ4PT_004104 [Festuca glaucescens]